MPAVQTKPEPVWRAREVAEITNGRWLPDLVEDLPITGVTFGLDTVAAGQLFFVARPEVRGAGFATKGQTLQQAAAAGAVGAVVDEGSLPQAAPLPVLAVRNTRDALHALALAARQRFSGRVAAVTGTVGKTSVCRMMSHVLERQGPTASSIGRRNFLPGLRATMCSTRPDFGYAVFELNTGGEGTIAPKSKLLRPDVAVITAVGLAHLEQHRGGIESVVRTKAGIAEGLRPGGTLILPRDSPWYDTLAENVDRGGVRIVTFGEHMSADVRLVRGEFGPDGSRLDLQMKGRDLHVQLSAPGPHVALNCLAVLAAVEALGGDVDKAAADVADWRAPPGRGRTSVLRLPDGDAFLIDCSYNANPDSMKAAIELLGLMPPRQNGRRVAVLSDMLELGEASGRCHEDLALPLIQSGADLVFTKGARIRGLRQSLPADRLAPHFDDIDHLVPALERGLRAGDVVMIQGSRATEMGKVVERLKAIERTSEFLFDIGEGRILHQIAMDAPRFPASLVKLMTLNLIFSALDAQKVSLGEQMTVSAQAAHLHPQSSRLGLAEGDRLTVEEAIRGLIVQSANDAAICAAEHLGGSQANFVAQMNQAARGLGLPMTSFANPSGEHDSGNRTTAHEVAAIALSIVERFPGYLHYFAERGFTYKGRRFPPRNRLITSYPGLQGMKTGHVPASGYHLVALAQRGARRLLSVVMGAHDRDARDRRTAQLLDLGFASDGTGTAADLADGRSSVGRQDGAKA
jgi:UDP-N-acetylmuramoyl-tripeptide--D-alanyl-D-alanine ligase